LTTAGRIATIGLGPVEGLAAGLTGYLFVRLVKCE
jgi:hypothetical protein